MRPNGEILLGHSSQASLSPPSAQLDNKHCLVVDEVLFANLAQMIVSCESVFQQCIADVFCWSQAVLAHDSFELEPVSIIAAVINPVGVKEKSVSGTDQRDLGDIGRVRPPLPELH